MPASLRLKREIRRNKSSVFRRVFIRRMLNTGIFEDEWQDVSKYVKKWGKITQAIDPQRYSKLNFNGFNMVFDNQEGLFSDESDQNSFWYGFASQQRTLIKLEFGLKSYDLGEDGIWRINETNHSVWDSTLWDAGENFDEVPTKFTGIISGDMLRKGDYDISVPIMPTTEIFRGFPASKLVGFTSTGITASKFVEIVRDMTDGGGNFLFRQFLGDTSTNWTISPTTNIYAEMNTSGSALLINKSIWQVMENIAEAEDFVVHVTGEGEFKFVPRESNTTTSQFEFFGLGYSNRDYGHTIKDIESYGPRFSNFYTRVQVKFNDEDTVTSYAVSEMTIAVSGSNFAWIYGHRPYNIDNYLIADLTTAAAIAQNVFDNVSQLKDEITFNAPMIVGVNVLDRIQISYDSNPVDPQSLWDLFDWGDDNDEVRRYDLIFDSPEGDNILLEAAEFNVVSIETDLDGLGVKIQARET